jgi:hypothetical protein
VILPVDYRSGYADRHSAHLILTRTGKPMRTIKGLLVGLTLIALGFHPAAAESVQLVQSSGVFMLPVRINDAVVVPFVLDSGAAEVVIPADVFLSFADLEQLDKQILLEPELIPWRTVQRRQAIAMSSIKWR